MPSYKKSDVADAVRKYFTSSQVSVSAQLTDLIVQDLWEAHSQGEKPLTQEDFDKVLLNLRNRPQGVALNAFKVCVFGGGAFGTAMACSMARMGHRVEMLMLEQELPHVQSINEKRINTMCFPKTELPRGIMATTNAKAAIDGASLIFHAIPVQFSRNYLKKVAPLISANVPIVSVSKGITLDNLEFMTDVFKQSLSHTQPTAYVAGPSFAIGVIAAAPTWCTIASENIEVARQIQQLVSSTTFRTYCTDDVIGVEACSALKNVLSILCGMSLALGFGPNTTNGLLTRGWADLRRLVVALGGRSETMTGLSGVGDLMLTCYGGLSRNAKFGELIAKGNTVQQALDGAGGVVEGLPTAHATVKLAEKHKVRVPVLKAISVMLSGKISAKDLVQYVMTLPLEDEFQNKEQQPSSKL